MCQNCLVKTIHHAQHHFGWDNSLSPVLHVASGSQLEFHCLDAANGWFNAGSTAADIPTLPFDKLNPVSGPVYVEGAQPGDALKVTLESFRPAALAGLRISRASACWPISFLIRRWRCGNMTGRA